MKAFILKIAISLLAKTWRINIPDLPKFPALIGFWHGQMLPAWYIFRKSNPVGVVSLSKDGSLLSSLLEYWGFELIRGSSSKGGKEVLDQILHFAQDRVVVMIPDGPRGPRQEMKAGLIVASKKSEIPFYFLKIDIKSKWIFEKAWDKFQLPKPLSKINIEISGPFSVDKDLERDQIDALIKKYSDKFKC